MFLFDVDGTLVPSSAVHGEAFDHALRTIYGQDVTIAGVNGEGRTDRWILTRPLLDVRMAEETISQRLPDAFRAMVDYFNHHLERVQPIVLPGVEELLKALLNAGYQVGLLTGNIEGIARTKLRRVGLDKYLQYGAFGEGSNDRAALVPLALASIQQAIGLSIGHDYVAVIGDTPLDVAAARHHNLKAAAVATGLYAPDTLRVAGADVVIPSFADWPAAMRQLITLVSSSRTAVTEDDQTKWGDIEWNRYWQARTGEAWRIAPPVTAKRERVLRKRLRSRVDIKNGRFPFARRRLTRSDVEWLLHNHVPVEVEEAAQSYPRKGIDLRGAILNHVDLHSLPLTRMKGGLTWYEWKEVVPKNQDLWEKAAVKLRGADLHETHLERANLFRAHLEGADLRGVHFDSMTDLEGAYFGDGKLTARVADLRWNGVNLAVVDLSTVRMLGDEVEARAPDRDQVNGQKRDRFAETQRAIRANRQLASALQDQGLNDQANTFTYRAQKLHARLLTLEIAGKGRSFWSRVQSTAALIFSKLLDGLAGYGHKPQRALGWYAATILAFAIIYWRLGDWKPGQIGAVGGLLLSVNSFHGRAFFPGGVSITQGWAALPVVEAVIGLFIEISLIAAFTRRFLGG